MQCAASTPNIIRLVKHDQEKARFMVVVDEANIEENARKKF
jgi:hypothetical protein